MTVLRPSVEYLFQFPVLIPSTMQSVLKTNVKIFTCFSITIVIVVTVLDRVYRNAFSPSKLVMYCI